MPAFQAPWFSLGRETGQAASSGPRSGRAAELWWVSLGQGASAGMQGGLGEGIKVFAGPWHQGDPHRSTEKGCPRGAGLQGGSPWEGMSGEDGGQSALAARECVLFVE